MKRTICFKRVVVFHVNDDKELFELAEETAYRYNRALNELNHILKREKITTKREFHNQLYDYAKNTFKLKGLQVSTLMLRLLSKAGRRTKSWNSIFFDSKEPNVKLNFDEDDVFATIYNPFVDLPNFSNLLFKKYNYLNKILSKWEIKGYGVTTVKPIKLARKKSFVKIYIPIKFCNEVEIPYEEAEGTKIIGVDIGFRNLVAFTDGKTSKVYSGKSLVNIINRRQSLIKEINKKLKTSKNKRFLLHRKYEHYRKLRSEVKRQIGEATNLLLSSIEPGTVIVVEDLRWLSNKVNNRPLSKNAEFLYRLPYRQILETIKYKAEMIGASVFKVEPEFTSQTCPICKYVDKNNRKGERFVCKNCGYTNNSDIVAAMNIRNKFLNEFDFWSASLEQKKSD